MINIIYYGRIREISIFPDKNEKKVSVTVSVALAVTVEPFCRYPLESRRRYSTL